MKTKAANNTAPLVVGTGLVALDVVVSDRFPEITRHWAGGTCGNVLLALRYLGWQAAPVARLRPGTAATRLVADLDVWGIKTAFVSVSEDGSTPVIVQKIRRTPKGEPFHTFSWRCLNCGSRFPGYKPVLANVVELLVPQIGTPRVFFFDRLSRGALLLARSLAECGTAVVFEPSSIGNPALFREAWAIADVVKYSHERLQDLPADLDNPDGPGLQIETSGKEGLRYRTRLTKCRRRAWRHLPSLPALRVWDTAGAGDWCTAGLIHRLLCNGKTELLKADDGGVQSAIRYGQALAAWACGFEGARGGMYESTKAAFEQDVANILGAAIVRDEEKMVHESPAASGIDCLCPSCEQPPKTERSLAKPKASARG